MQYTSVTFSKEVTDSPNFFFKSLEVFVPFGNPENRNNSPQSQSQSQFQSQALSEEGGNGARPRNETIGDRHRGDRKKTKQNPTNQPFDSPTTEIFFFFAGSECAENAIHGLNSYSRLVKVFYLPDSQCDYGCELPR